MSVHPHEGHDHGHGAHDEQERTADLLVELTGLTVEFPSRAGRVQAVRGMDLGVERGEVLGVVGESGSGKTITRRRALSSASSPRC